MNMAQQGRCAQVTAVTLAAWPSGIDLYAQINDNLIDDKMDACLQSPIVTRSVR